MSKARETANITTSDQTIAGVKTFSSSPVVTATQGTGANNVLKYGTINTANSTPVKTALNAGGNAPIYACRAWVNFDGTTTPPTIRASGNVSSVTRDGVGRYKINFSTAMVDANYVVTGAALDTLASSESNSPNVALGNYPGSIRTASGVSIDTVDGQGNSFVSSPVVTVAIFR